MSEIDWKAPVHDPERELRDHGGDWERAMAQIASAHGLEPLPLEPFTSGSDVVWAVGPDHVVKLTAPRWSEEIAAEAGHLALVAGRLSVATPEPVARGEIDGWPYVVMGRVAGSSIGSVWEGLGRGERERLSAELGALVGELHQVRPGPADEFRPFFADCQLEVARRHSSAPPKLVAEIDGLLEEVGPLDDGSRVFLHTEVLHEHVLVKERGGRFELCAMIDFADSRLGPAGYEFPAPVEFLLKGEPGLFARFLDGYANIVGERPDDDPRLRLAWGLCHRFGSLKRMLAAAPRPVSSLRDLARALYS